LTCLLIHDLLEENDLFVRPTILATDIRVNQRIFGFAAVNPDETFTPGAAAPRGVAHTY
jgi:hypothetical protein